MLGFLTGLIWEVIRLYFFLIGVVAFLQKPLEWLEFTYEVGKFVEHLAVNGLHLVESYYYLL